MTRLKLWTAVSTAALMFALTTACTKPEAERVESRAEELRRDTADALNTAQERSEEAWESLKDATWDRREEFRSTAKMHASQLKEELEELGQKVRTKTGEGTEEVREQWAKLTSDRSALERQVDRLGDATEDGWNASRGAVHDSYAKLRREIID
jgi:F0F1-type ATP synthase membrane subunit b/b'